MRLPALAGMCKRTRWNQDGRAWSPLPGTMPIQEAQRAKIRLPPPIGKRRALVNEHSGVKMRSVGYSNVTEAPQQISLP